MKRPMTMWDRIRCEGMQPQVGDVMRIGGCDTPPAPGIMRSEGVGEPVTVNGVSGEIGKSLAGIGKGHILEGMRIAFFHGNGDMALDNGDCWEYVSRADGGPVHVDDEEATGGQS